MGLGVVDARREAAALTELNFAARRSSVALRPVFCGESRSECDVTGFIRNTLMNRRHFSRGMTKRNISFLRLDSSSRHSPETAVPLFTVTEIVIPFFSLQHINVVIQVVQFKFLHFV